MAIEGRDPLQKLRQRAEALLSPGLPSARVATPEDIRALAHDLSVHQVELEIQNEELQAAYQRLDTAFARYALLYHQAPVGFLSLDANGVILQCNQTFNELLGDPTGDLTGTSLASLLDTPGREIFLGRYRAVFSAPEGKILEARLLRKGKGPLDIRLTGRLEEELVKAEPNAPPFPHLLVAVADISLEKAAEQATRDAHQFNEQVIRSAGEGIIVLGPDLRFRVWNPFMERQTGLLAEDMLGRHPLEVFPFLRDTGAREDLERALAGVEGPTREFRYRIQGSSHSGWAQGNSSPLRNAAGSVIGVIATVQDITARKAHEYELERMNRLYDLLSHLGQSLVNARTREGLLQDVCTIAAERGRFRLAWVGWVDPTTSRILPVASAGPGVGYLEGIEVSLDARPEGQGPTATCIRQNRSYVCQDFAQDDRTQPWRVRAEAFGLRGSVAVPISFRGQVVGALMIYSEEPEIFLEREVALVGEVAATITFGLEHLAATEEHRKLEAQISRAQKMESLGILAGGVAHDMNNVLGAILGLASANLPDQPEESRTHRALETIVKAAERGGKMVQRLLSFARESPAEELELDLNGILRDEVRLLERTTLARVCLELDLEPDLRLIRGDASALAHSFMNLCINAVDAMPEGGTLTLRTRNKAEGWIEILVADNGSGMTPEVLERAIDPYFTTKAQGKGTGLGLPMVYTTVKAHHGELLIQSEPGQGTQVRVQFPAIEPTTASKALSKDRPIGLAKDSLKVLLVDDDELIRTTFMMLLEVLGHEASTAARGEMALEMLATQAQPDVVILDMNMPGLGGQGTLPRLRSLCPTLPVLLATGRVDQTALDLVAAHPGVTLLSKPFSLAELQQYLEVVTGR